MKEFALVVLSLHPLSLHPLGARRVPARLARPRDRRPAVCGRHVQLLRRHNAGHLRTTSRFEMTPALLRPLELPASSGCPASLKAQGVGAPTRPAGATREPQASRRPPQSALKVKASFLPTDRRMRPSTPHGLPPTPPPAILPTSLRHHCRLASLHHWRRTLPPPPVPTTASCPYRPRPSHPSRPRSHPAARRPPRCRRSPTRPTFATTAPSCVSRLTRSSARFLPPSPPRCASSSATARRR